MSPKHTLFLIPPYPLVTERIPGVLLDQSLKWLDQSGAGTTPQKNLKRWLEGPIGEVTPEEVEGVERFLLEPTHLSNNRSSLLSRIPQGSDGRLDGGFDDEEETILAPTVLALALRSFLMMFAVGTRFEVRGVFMSIVPISEIVRELSVAGLKDRILVRGAFRASTEAKNPKSVPVLELDGLSSNTIKVLLEEPKLNQDAAKSVFTEDQFLGQPADSLVNWWSSWSTTLVAAGILNPIVDPKMLLSLLQERRRLRVFCDTNALAGGVATWCAEIFAGKIDFVTSAVVDREVMAWSQTKDARQAKNLKAFHERTRYLLSYQLTENAPEGVVIERLAPDQSALMLAKLRDEEHRIKGEVRIKSPDADILLMELARAYVRDAPRNTRVVFLTGDRALARAATSTLGGEAVLYAAAPTSLAENAKGKVFGRGWWVPGGLFGTIKRPPLNHVLWSLLAPCEYLVLSDFSGAEWVVRQKFSSEEGVPSEWNSPRIEIRQLSPAKTSPPKTKAEEGTKNETTKSFQEWILEEIPDLPVLDNIGRARVYPEMLFETLGYVLFGTYPDPQKQHGTKENWQDVLKNLMALGAINEKLKPGPRAEKFRDLWNENKLDKLHAEFLQLPNYREAVELLRRSSLPAPVPNKHETFIGLARRLGQVAKLGNMVYWGAAPLRTTDLLDFLERVIPRDKQQERTEVVCELAIKDLRVTPTRFERAMVELWKKYPEEVPFRPAFGGTPSNKDQQSVISLLPDGTFEFVDKIPGALMFGGKTPAQTIERKP